LPRPLYENSSVEEKTIAIGDWLFTQGLTLIGRLFGEPLDDWHLFFRDLTGLNARGDGANQVKGQIYELQHQIALWYLSERPT